LGRAGWRRPGQKGLRQPAEEIKKYLDRVSEQWDQALSRLKSFVEG
jgi:hypothetical protein